MKLFSQKYGTITHRIFNLFQEDQFRFDERLKYFPSHFNPRADFCGATALFYATLNNNVEMVKLLLDNGADPLIKLRSGLHPLEMINDQTENGIKIKALLLKVVFVAGFKSFFFIFVKTSV